MVSLIPWKKKSDIEVRNPSPLRGHSGYHPMTRFREEFDRLWDRFWDEWSEPCVSSSTFGNRWNLELDDNGNEYCLNAELPGFEPSEIDVSVSGSVMTIRAEHKEEKKTNNGSNYRYGSYRESFTLPCDVDSEKIDAKYHHGLLEVHLPKSDDCKAKKITVTAS